MLLNFTVKNYKTFKDEVEFSAVLSERDKTSLVNNIVQFPDQKISALKTSVVYGANASGKSKLFNAMNFMTRFILRTSSSSQKGDKIDVDPFRLNTETITQDSEFEMVFLSKDGIQYRYGFSLNRNKVTEEWLFSKAQRETEVFYRFEDEEIDYNKTKFEIAKLIKSKNLLRENGLLLSLADQLNDSLASEVIEWFKSFNVISGNEPEGYESFTIDKVQENNNFRSRVEKFLSESDLGIDSLLVKDSEFPDSLSQLFTELPEKIKVYNRPDINVKKDVFDKDYRPVDEKSLFNLFKDESEGTQKMFALSGPIIDTLENGKTLVIDELCSKLHTNLLLNIIRLFNSKEFNKNNAQLIFNTHNVYILDPETFRRDQIWFMDKNIYGESNLYSLDEIKGVRTSDQYGKNYLLGKYGATPNVHYVSVNSI
ncbi:ATP-binding protein [Halosquirtibacter xylanolyticus]|uniref:AAA family ATPase n=1 Tax=Halosquirtibacter xylanolyticus TaxID=3374599 RepID=UPI00374A5BB0|nr:ATP-binding protein [Prolixibacteraceae bacterium]